MAWTTPSQRSTGELITSSIYNTEIVDNLSYLKGEVDSLNAQVAGLEAIPAGLVAYTTGSVPAGWSEYTPARGRVIVGLPSGGTAAGTVGTALSNLENRTHTHVYTTVPAHSHTVARGTWYGSNTGSFSPSDGGSGGALSTSTTGSSSPSTQATSHMMPYIQLLAIKKD